MEEEVKQKERETNFNFPTSYVAFAQNIIFIPSTSQQ